MPDDGVPDGNHICLSCIHYNKTDTGDGREVRCSAKTSCYRVQDYSEPDSGFVDDGCCEHYCQTF